MNTQAILEPETPEVNDQVIIQLPDGLSGFERVNKYTVLARPQEAPFMWMQMMDATRKAFLIVSPFIVKPDYQPDIPAADAEYLGIDEPSDALLYAICTLRGPGRATVNLKGPIVVNRHTMVGKQVIPNNASSYPLDHPLAVA